MAGLTNMNASPLDQIEGLVNAATKILPRMARLADLLPPDTLEFKLNLLSSGCDRVGSNESLCRIQQRTIVLASGEDNLLPSKEEGRRLSRVLPRCQLETLPDASHAALQESNVDLLSILTKAGFDLDPNWTSRRTRHEKNPISIEKPSLREISAARESGVSFIRQLTSPAFFSTLDDGTIVRGLGGVPNEGQSMLLVGNHQTYAFDTGLLIDQFLIEQNRLIRGLAHPVIFRRSANQGNDATTAIGGARGAQGLGGFFTRFGAVEVTGKNFYKLLKNGETVLLFPGGVREAYKRKHEEYQLNWPSAPEFVRMASRHNACIVPFAAIGIDDAVNILLDTDELTSMPIIGERLKMSMQGLPVPTQRQNPRVKSDSSETEDFFIQPISIPKSISPQRIYVLFGKPIDLNDPIFNDIKKNDEEAITSLYRKIQEDIRSQLTYLLTERQADEFKDFPRRYVYETLNGEQAPSFL